MMTTSAPTGGCSGVREAPRARCAQGARVQDARPRGEGKADARIGGDKLGVVRRDQDGGARHKGRHAPRADPMDRRDDRRIHPLEPGDTAVQRGGPALDVRGKRGEIVDEGLDIAAIAESIALGGHEDAAHRSEEHTSELQSLMRISYAVFCLKKKKETTHTENNV